MPLGVLATVISYASGITFKFSTASNFKKSLGTSFDDFDVFIAVENLKVIPDAYDITVAKTPNGKAKFLHFKHESRQLQYWIAAEPGSVV